MSGNGRRLWWRRVTIVSFLLIILEVGKVFGEHACHSCMAHCLPKGSPGCHYAGQAESVHCYCSGEYCNEKLNLNFYTPKPLPTIECCECSELHEDKCPETKCLRTCRGNYCLIDFDGVEQGCGIGVPRLQNFLRLPHYPEHQGETFCARYQATLSTVVHGCVCTNPSGQCNEINKTRSYQLKNVIDRKVDDQNYCYSLHQKSKTPFTEVVFRQADTCEGHYCFVSMTTSELVIESEHQRENMRGHQDFVGLARPRYEILAGCLKVDDDKKITLGCTTEFSNSNEPIAIHCICDSHLCNYYHLLVNMFILDPEMDQEITGNLILR
uniref:Uncharacterized protein n=1 Tax=Acrobeloides nanus TaxID=290746 RepID=A0A914CFV7_9BILA